MIKGEKIFKGEKDIKYIFQKPYEYNENLIIVFSAFSPVGKPPKYNYRKTLDNYSCNKLFILDDFGTRASYYLCENRDFNIERSVIDLIRWVVEENNIKNIISTGSSKGGYAALYYGIKYGFNHIIAASPQYLLGDYLLKQTNSNNEATFIAGDTNKEDLIYLNSLMEKEIEKTKYNPNIFIHLGKGEKHYTNHVKPLIETFKKYNLEYNLDLGDYDKHNEVGDFFPAILKEKIKTIIGFPSLEIKENVTKVSTLANCSYKAITEPENKVAWYLMKDGKKIKEYKYATDKEIKIELEEKGEYWVKVFVINSKRLKVSTLSNKVRIE